MTSLPYTETSSVSNFIGFIEELDGVSVMVLPLFENVLMVASSPGIPATTMSPLSAVVC